MIFIFYWLLNYILLINILSIQSLHLEVGMIHLWVCVCVSSPVRWRVWTMPGCRPESPCLCSAAPDPSACSRSAGSGRRCRPLTPAARVGGETRRWPSPLPGGRCTAAPGEGWSCSTPVAGQGRDQESLNMSRLTVTDYLGSSQDRNNKKGFEFAHLVVVASGREMLVVRRPFETAHFLPVTLQPPLSSRGRPDVPLQDHSVPTPRRQLLSVPRQGTLDTKGREGRSHISLWLSRIHQLFLDMIPTHVCYIDRICWNLGQWWSYFLNQTQTDCNQQVLTDLHVPSGPPDWSASSLLLRPRSERSPCGFRRQQDSPEDPSQIVLLSSHY